MADRGERTFGIDKNNACFVCFSSHVSISYEATHANLASLTQYSLFRDVLGCYDNYGMEFIHISFIDPKASYIGLRQQGLHVHIQKETLFKIE